MHRHLVVIDEPAEGTRSVLVRDEGDRGVYFAGEHGDVDLLCGACGHVLATGMESPTQVQNIVLQCPACLKFNDTPV